MPPSSRAKKKPRDDDEEDRPRKSKKKKEQSRSNVLAIILVGGGAIAVILIFLVGITLWLVFRNRGGNNAEASALQQNMSSASARMNDANEKLAAATKKPQSYRPQLEQAQTTLKASRTESANWTVPGTPTAKSYYDCFQEVLQLNERQLQYAEAALANREKGQPPPQTPPPDAQMAAKIRELESLERRFAAENQITLVR